MREKTAKKILEKIEEDYNKISKEFDSTRQNNWEEFELLLPYLKNNQTLIDIGCGNGRLLKFIKDKSLNTKINYFGIDISEKLLNSAKKIYKDTKFLKATMLELPIKKNFADTIAAIASFHHIPSKKLRKMALQEIKRILKPNGILFLTVWNLFQKKYKKYIWKARAKHLLSFGKYDYRDTFIPWGKTGVNRYYYAFKEKELKNLLESENFEIINSKKGNNFLFICKKK